MRRKMRIRGQIIDFIEDDSPQEQSIYDKLIEIRDRPSICRCQEDIKLIVEFLVGRREG